MKRLRRTVQVAIAVATAATLAGCATLTGAPSAPAEAASSIQTVDYYPYLVKGYQKSFPRRSIDVLLAVDERDKDANPIDSAPLDGNPQVGVTLDKDGAVAQRLYSSPLGPIVQKAITQSAAEAGLAAHAAAGSTYQARTQGQDDYVLAATIRRCWVKKSRGADGRYGAVWRTQADFALEVTVYKPPFSVPFWNGTTSDVYFDPPVGSFGLGPEDEAGIYDEPGQVLSVALTRAVAAIFQRQDLRNLMMQDDIRKR